MRNSFLIAFTGSILGVAVFYYLAISEDITNSLKVGYIIAAVSGIVSAFIVFRTSKFLDAKIPWHSKTSGRLLAGIFFNSLFVYLFIWLIVFLYTSYYEPINDQEAIYFFKLKLVILIVILVFLFTIIYFVFYSYHYYQYAQISALRLERKRIDLQLDALKSQLSPHFLFNNLNTISSLYHKSADKAIHFVRQMGRCYEYTLNSYEKVCVSVKEELVLVNSYYHLMQTRFENQLKLSIDIDKTDENRLIPTLSIQLLVENAIKHNRIIDDSQLHIEIFSKGDAIQVCNNVTKNPDAVESFKIGLSNIEKRYKLLTKKGISFEQGDRFCVTLPLIDE
ncbi:histidine kinase [Spongiivirga sp. MCCC 1A20706]|uniref:sensor histidine kinase n=1 Tax=Spongiivirga sp. MCCC 1A20706 TaxID=3160963 RepID=UPI00397748A0